MAGPDLTTRPLAPEELGVLNVLLGHNFPGVEELRVQAQRLLARKGCKCGCGTIHLLPQGSAMRASRVKNAVPVEGAVQNEAGESVGGVLLFVHDGYLAELEVYSFYDAPLPMPDPSRVRVVSA